MQKHLQSTMRCWRILPISATWCSRWIPSSCCLNSRSRRQKRQWHFRRASWLHTRRAHLAWPLEKVMTKRAKSRQLTAERRQEEAVITHINAIKTCSSLWTSETWVHLKQKLELVPITSEIGLRAITPKEPKPTLTINNRTRKSTLTRQD